MTHLAEKIETANRCVVETRLLYYFPALVAGTGTDRIAQTDFD